jgi:hypothetical protein
MNFEVSNGNHGLVARLTVALTEEQQSLLKRRLSRLLTSECASRGLVIRGEISIEVQVNLLTTTLDASAAAFVVATDRTGANATKRPASGAGNATRRTA